MYSWREACNKWLAVFSSFPDRSNFFERLLSGKFEVQHSPLRPLCSPGTAFLGCELRQQHLTVQVKAKGGRLLSHSSLHVNYPEPAKWNPSTAYLKHRQHTLLLQELQRPPLTIWEEALQNGRGVSSSQLLSHKVKGLVWEMQLDSQLNLPTLWHLGQGTNYTTVLPGILLICLHHRPRPSTRSFPPDYSSSLLSGPLSLFLTNSEVYPHTKRRRNFRSNHIIPRLKILLWL